MTYCIFYSCLCLCLCLCLIWCLLLILSVFNFKRLCKFLNLRFEKFEFKVCCLVSCVFVWFQISNFVSVSVWFALKYPILCLIKRLCRLVSCLLYSLIYLYLISVPVWFGVKYPISCLLLI